MNNKSDIKQKTLLDNFMFINCAKTQLNEGENKMAKDEIDFGAAIVEDDSLGMDIFGGGGNYLKTPEVNAPELIFTIVDIKDDSKNAMGKTKEGVEFCKGFTDKNGKHKYDVITDTGAVYTVKSAEVFYAMGRVLKEYAAKNPTVKPSWRGAKISIKHLFDGSHSDMKLPLLKASLSIAPYNKTAITDEEALAYQAQVKQAKKEYRLYEVKLLN